MSLRSLVLTPERIPAFFVPSRSPLLRRRSPDRTRLLSDHDDVTLGSSPPSDSAQPQGLLCLPTPRLRRPRPESADVDVTTHAALSLPHVDKVTTPYGFSAVLATSPCTRRRESLFHHSKPAAVSVTVKDADLQHLEAPPTPPGRPQVSSRPGRALGLMVIKELKKPAAALKALSPAARRR
ncbi:C2 calcium-dependent domain-containing protein 4A-like [Cheilinus undulatus]|uniref:C2 calcium-dependent domain-containing protein 4A-like n=1 Tax=Cheilinus undulatus TaxID=241271 RepID=UPI001BD316B2|nr:C2 calcium-dependent domain-containing protein 4A-like [Cheilinus undulatus]